MDAVAATTDAEGAPAAALNPNTPNPPIAAKTAETDGVLMGVVAWLGGLDSGSATCLDAIVSLMNQG